MQNVYLLLRNNQQEGPYSLDELLQLRVKSSDLIWEEGRSAAWRFPFEVESLQPYVSAPEGFELPSETVSQKQTAASTMPTAAAAMMAQKKVFVKMPEVAEAPAPPVSVKEVAQPAAAYQPAFYQPAPVQSRTPDPIEEKAEALRRKLEAYAGHREAAPRETVSKYAAKKEVEETNYSSIYSRKPSPKRNMKPALFGIALLGVAAIGYSVLSRSGTPDPAGTVSAHVVPPAHQNTPAPTGESQEPNEDAKMVADENSTAITPNKRKIPAEKLIIPTRAGKKDSPAETVQPVSREPEPVVPSEEIKKPENAPAPQQGNSEPLKKEKKKIGERVKELFKKDRKDGTASESVIEEPRPATDRQAARRGNTEPAPTVTPADPGSLAQNVDISSNAPDNFMMGVKGVQVTLRNRNGVPLQSAWVGVHYYDGNNRLLEKKVVRFDAIAAKGKKTMSAPDHKFADHIELQLEQVTAGQQKSF